MLKDESFILFFTEMVERLPLSDRIHKTTTSRIALIGLAAAAMMMTFSMIGAIQLQEASAAPPLFQWCFDSTIYGHLCYGTKEDCRSNQSDVGLSPETRCHREKAPPPA